jgi:uncharacterized protein (DUF169 family)
MQLRGKAIMCTDYKQMASKLTQLLGLAHSPIAITFVDEVPKGVQKFGVNHPAASPDGRTGAVPAGCVFWIKAEERTFSTEPADHGNCSVGSLTHGLISLEEAATRGDVKAVCEARWVNPEVFPHIPVVKERANYIIYGPLAETSVAPDVVFFRVVGKQAMMLNDALPELRFEGKPQCHIVAVAKEKQQAAVSVGCMLSRVRTGLSNNEMTCAVPAGQLSDLLDALEKAQDADLKVAAYAGQDSQRFR